MTRHTFAAMSDNLVGVAVSVFAIALLIYALRLARTSARRTVAAGAVMEHETDQRDVAHGGFVTDRAAQAVVLAGTGFLALAVLARGIAAGRAPWGNMYEFVLVAVLVLATTFLVFRRHTAIADLGLWVTGLILTSLGVAITILYTPSGALVPVLNSYWLVIHVAAAIIAAGVFSVGAIASGLFLVAERRGRPAAHLDRLAHATNLFAFPIWTFAVIAGAIWAENSWGRYWGWDPKETWAFITWVCYAAYLHAQSTAGWRGRRANLLALAGYAALLFNLFGVNMWITGLHSYAGV